MKIIPYDEFKELHRIAYIPNKHFTDVLYCDGDLSVTEDLTQDWSLLEELNIANESLLIYIKGNLTVNGKIAAAIDSNYPTLYVTGHVECDEMISGDSEIYIRGNATIKYALKGDYSEGSIEIVGQTYVPYVLNSEHDLDITTGKETIAICYSGDDYNIDYDYEVDDLPRVMESSVMQDGEFQYDRFIELVRNGISPFKQSSQKPKTSEQLLKEKLSNLLHDPDAVTELDISNSNLSEFPEQLLQLKNLKVLKLSNNPMIFKIPQEITTLQNLEELYIQNGNAKLPEEIVTLSKLSILDLHGNNAALPANIGELTSLKQLSCKFDATRFPDSIKNLQNLTHLTLSGMITDFLGSAPDSANFPEQVCELSQLKYLKLEEQRFINLPERINQLTNLERFDCSTSFQKIQEMPTLTGLKNLTQVNIGNAFDNPCCIQAFFNITTLTSLAIDNYKTLEPAHLEGIDKLINLENLNISKNKLTTLPDDVYKLNQLKRLNINNTNLCDDVLDKLEKTYPNAIDK